MRSVELFAGAGGLGMAVERAGFKHAAVIERDRWCCDTMRENKDRGVDYVKDWRIEQADVTTFDYRTISEPIDLVAGGPPCQPFSLGGKHRSYKDRRDMFSEVVRAVRELRPQAIIVENVKGLIRKPFAHYVEYIRLQLTYPEIRKLDDNEDWRSHLSRLQKVHTSGVATDLQYQVVLDLLNAAHYGVPQKRERVFFVGFRSDVGANWSFDTHVLRTHSQARLLWDQWETGDYWQRHGLRPRRPQPALRKRMEAIRNELDPNSTSPWRTVRDAICDLPDPRTANAYLNHKFNPGARSYKGHTGSPLDEPAKTLKAGDHGVPGGENMLRHPNGAVRYFTVRESARLQCFPDDYAFHGSWTETMRQLGNAVPVRLGEAVATSVAEHLRGLKASRQ